MRELAVQLKVDLNTVRHAYEELEQTSAIVIQQAIALTASAGIDPAEVAHEMLQLVRRHGGKR
jgi:DNA-binding transcriptional regulator YhcF (GntR family)